MTFTKKLKITSQVHEKEIKMNIEWDKMFLVDNNDIKSNLLLSLKILEIFLQHLIDILKLYNFVSIHNCLRLIITE